MTNAVSIAQQGSNNTTFRNRIINGAMTIDQRNAGASVTPADGAFVLDRWKCRLNQASKYSVQQNAGSVTPPVGFSNYLGVTSLSAFTPASGDFFNFQQPIEGFNWADLNWGTANAKTVTLSFQVYSSLTGLFGGRLINSAGNRVYPFTYTVSSANTWTTISVTIAGDTTGSWVGATNGIGVTLAFDLGSGSAFETSSPNAWGTSDAIRTSACVRVISTNGATFYITGVQLEAGSAASPFENRLYGTELSLCQRYYYLLTAANNSATFFHNLAADATNHALGVVTFPQVMRTSPSLVTSGTASHYRVYLAGGFTTCNSVPAIDQACPYSSNVGYGVASGLTNGQGGCAAAASTTSAFLGFNAEL